MVTGVEMHSAATWPSDVHTLAIDIGGSGIKAAVLDPHGTMVSERVRVDTPYPCPPSLLVSTIGALVEPLPRYDRVSAGYPGLVRDGHVIDVPSLTRRTYDGPRDAELTAAWQGFPLAPALAERLQRPTKVVNDADMQGCAVIQGSGLEFVMTLGTGVGTALFHDGALLPHLELSHCPFIKGHTIDTGIGNVERKRIGKDKWRERVRQAIRDFNDMLYFDHLYVGGGNAKHLLPEDVGPRGSIVANSAGIIGGVRIWDLDRRGAW